MSSTFGGYSIAVSGMYVNRTGLSTTSHNISNINTAGFSRQQMVGEEQNIVQPGVVSSGRGSSLEEIRRGRSQFVDKTYREMNTQASYWEAKSANLEDLQQILNEFPAENGAAANTGLQQTLQDFFNSWEELSKDPTSQSSRSAVKENGDSLAGILNQMAEQLGELRQDGCNKIKDTADKLNGLASQIAGLNVQITKTEVLGAKANDLRDQRDKLIDELSSEINITVNENANGKMNISIGGVSLVDGENTYTLSVVGDGSTTNPLKLQWDRLGYEVNVTGGQVQAYLEDVNPTGMQAINTADIPVDFKADATSSISNLWQGLNDLITTLAIKINESHGAGTGLDGSTGIDFFIAADPNKPLSLSNIKVNPELNDVNKIAASASGEAGDNTIASRICSVKEQNVFQYNGLSMNLENFYQANVSWLGTAGQTANGLYDTKNNLTLQADNQRQAISGVSMDEELSNMIMYQNAYSANARVLSTIDGLVGDLIKSLG